MSTEKPEESAFQCKIVSADEVSGLLRSDDLRGFLKSSLEFATSGAEPKEDAPSAATTTTTTTTAKSAAPALPAFKNPFKKAVEAPPPAPVAAKPGKPVGKRLRRDAAAESSDDDDASGQESGDDKPNESEDEEEEEDQNEEEPSGGDDDDDEDEDEDGVDPEPKYDSDSGRSIWHPNPYADQKCNDDKVVDLSAKKEKTRNKKKNKDKHTRSLALQFLDMEASVSGRKREQDEEDASKPERVSDKKRVSIASYTGDGPSVLLTSGKSSHRLLVVRAGMPLDFKFKKGDDFDAKVMHNLKYCNVYWIVQCYKKNAKENVFVPCAVTSNGVAIRLLSKHWKQIKKGMSPQVMDAIVKTKNIDPRITQAYDAEIHDPDKRCHADVKPFFGKVPLVTPQVYESLCKFSRPAVVLKVKNKPPPKKQKKEDTSPALPLQKGQLTIAECMSSPTTKIKKVAEPVAPKPVQAQYTPVGNIAKMLEEAKALIHEKLDVLVDPVMFNDPKRRECVLVNALQSMLSDEDPDKHLKHMWLTFICCNDTRYGNVLEWMGVRPPAPPAAPPAPPKKIVEALDPWLGAVRGE